MKVTLLNPGTFKLDGGAMFGIIPRPLWEKRIAPDDKNRIQMSLRCVLVQTENRNVLIDTGIGNYHDDKFERNFDLRPSNHSLILGCLEKVNLTGEDITDIILTHLHFDHVGGLGGPNGEVLFPSANLHIHNEHMKYAKHPTLRDKGSFHLEEFMPLLKYYQENNQLNLLKNLESNIIFDGDDFISYKTSFGHTPYMIHPIFDDYIYMADLLPMSHHVNIPWVMGYDIEPGTTTLYKKEFYKMIIECDLTVIFEHDIDIWGAKLSHSSPDKYKIATSFESNGDIVETIL